MIVVWTLVPEEGVVVLEVLVELFNDEVEFSLV